MANWKKQGHLKPWKNSTQPVIQYNRYRLSLWEWMVAVVKGGSICGLLAYTFFRSMFAFYLMLPFGLFYPFYEHKKKRDKRLGQLASQFKEGMMVLASALSAGYSIENAMEVSARELALLYGEDGLITGEFAYMVQQMGTNQSVEMVLGEFGERSGLEDIKNFSEVFRVAKRSGGDLSGIMRHTADVIRDKMQVKEEIATLTASKQFEQKIMNVIPFFIVFYVEGSSPGFFHQMYGTAIGRILMGACLVVYLLAYGLSKKILAIEV